MAIRSTTKLGGEMEFSKGDLVEVRDCDSETWERAIFIAFDDVTGSLYKYVCRHNPA